MRKIKIAGFNKQDTLYIHHGNTAECGTVRGGAVFEFSGISGSFVISLHSLKAAIKWAETPPRTARRQKGRMG